ncbi:hypothetical protein CRYUN_Cryun22dG0115100 [Craigia yunnanensis]
MNAQILIWRIFCLFQTPRYTIPEPAQARKSHSTTQTYHKSQRGAWTVSNGKASRFRSPANGGRWFFFSTKICREDGVILDFAGPNFVCVGNFTFRAVVCFIQINKDKECCISPHSSAFKGDQEYQHDDPWRETLTWNDALRKSTSEFQHRSYSLFTCNCHSFCSKQPEQYVSNLGLALGGTTYLSFLALFASLLVGWFLWYLLFQEFDPFCSISTLQRH